MARLEEIQKALKSVIKTEGFSYTTLGERLGKDRSTVFRMVSGADLSTARLLEILAAIGVEPAAFFATLADSTHTNVDPPSLTPKQEKELRSDFRPFAVYWKMAVERQTPAAIKKAGELTDEKFKRIEAQLKALGLDPEKPPIELKGAGPLMTEIRERWTKRSLERAMHEDPNQPRITQVLLTLQAAAELESAVKALHQTAVTASQTSRATHLKELKLVTLVTTTTEGSLIESYRNI